MTEFVAALVIGSLTGSAATSQTTSSKQMVIRVKDGGAKPDQFCIPAWSIANETVVAQPSGGVTVDTSAAREGAMRGAAEPKR